MSPTSNFCEKLTVIGGVRTRLLKMITLAVFFCLPRKLTNVFVSLSIVSMVLKLRDKNLQTEQTLLAQIENLLKIHLSENILVLPEQTVYWFWDERILQQQMTVRGDKIALKELLLDPKTFMANSGAAVNVLLSSLPMSVQYKLKLFKVENRLKVKHNIVSALMYA